MTIPFSAADLLGAAADLIERDGWRRGGGDPHGSPERTPRCLMRAMSDVWVQSITTRRSAWQLAMTAVEQTIEHSGYPPSIPQWNDIHCRDQDQAVTMLRTATVALFLLLREGHPEIESLQEGAE